MRTLILSLGIKEAIFSFQIILNYFWKDFEYFWVKKTQNVP